MFRDVIPVNNGFGYDGLIYGKHAQADDFFAFFDYPGLSSQRTNRVLPGFIVYGALTFTDLEKTTARVVLGFQILNLVSLLVTAFFLWRLCCLWRMRRMGFWFAAVAIFVNFMNLNMPYYDPVLTDTASIMLSMIVIYAAFRRSLLLALTAIVLAQFTWPPLSFLAVVLFFCKPQTNPLRATTAVRLRKIVNICLITVWTMGLVAGAYSVISGPDLLAVSDTTPIQKALWPVTIGTLVAFSVCAIVPLSSYWMSLSWINVMRRVDIIAIISWSSPAADRSPIRWRRIRVPPFPLPLAHNSMPL